MTTRGLGRWTAAATAILTISAMALTANGCKAKRRIRVETVEEEGSPLASTVRMSDPKTATQLVRGFYALEQGAWRWTKGQFSVTLRPPAGSAQTGAKLEMKMTFPEAVIGKVGPMTLTGTVSGHALEPETFTKAGDVTYQREIPGAVLGADAVTFDFQFDKFIPAGQIEERELAAIVLSVGLAKK